MEGKETTNNINKTNTTMHEYMTILESRRDMRKYVDRVS